VAEGRRQLEKHKVILDSVEKEIGVEREIVVAIWGIESRYGKHKGAYNMFRTLNTMFDAYPRRRDFYRQQLVEYLLLCRENSVDYVSVTGSYGAAFGQTQFIPSSFRQYAVDFDHDGKRDVWESVPDILASIANYLHSFGWTMGAPITAELGRELKDQRLVEAFSKGRSGLLPWSEVGILQQVSLPQQPGERKLSVVGLELEEGDMRYVAGYPNFQAITKWNNSNRYAMAVTELAAMLKEGGGM
ncbi:MAG: lytic murein transglycosylase, partial [Desulfobulbaceae bacterium]|nr:lytic murein transglycosylase [Desulfobulbaceae bacterium]